MSRFVEAPAQLSKSRLKSDLVAHNVALPPARSKKEVYVGLYLQHIDQRNAGDFSSDEEDQGQDVADKEEYTEMPDPSGLTDDDLKAALLEHGFKAGPIVETTRALYEKKLRKLLQSNGHGCVNGVEKGVLYSDNEEGEEHGSDEQEEDKELGTEEEKEETVKDQAQQGSSQVELCFQNGGFVYPQCFLLSSRLLAHASRNGEPSFKWNSGNAVQSSGRSQSRCSQVSVGISRASSVDQHSGLGSGLTQEPVKDTIKNMFPNTDAKTPGIYATRRRPIKGAAGRPVQYAYPVTPVSPTTLEKREVERRLVPIQIQILVFLIVTCLLYFIYVCVEDNSFSSTVALLESLYQEADSQDGLLLQAETQDVPALSGQD
ncbi:LEM domain-containing protein 1 isoform X3 [Etheostoma cragini]|uniref:LEM domain-containing protein 1 isoform X3 n=1 Tax=Etheostoma cragini TaxID=417921 RepID=UPI00155E3D81|nr:LEM domain-containing protein 1 isoform X3 [Etheostoma cragini]